MYYPIFSGLCYLSAHQEIRKIRKNVLLMTQIFLLIPTSKKEEVIRENESRLHTYERVPSLTCASALLPIRRPWNDQQGLERGFALSNRCRGLRKLGLRPQWRRRVASHKSCICMRTLLQVPRAVVFQPIRETAKRISLVSSWNVIPTNWLDYRSYLDLKSILLKIRPANFNSPRELVVLPR